ncbi:MAG: GNAT family N-acetyltransferase, partial [Atopobium sp.]|nr:GNAT family N-acetyltransferase [Atopobium sp.]
MSITVNNFRQEYIPGIIDCWNRTLKYDQIEYHRFIKDVFLDENFDSSLALTALDENKVIGFCLGIKRRYPYLTRGLEESRGWISVMFIAPEYQKTGIGHLIYRECEDRLKEKGVKEITLCAYSPNYFTPGIDLNYPDAISFFEKLGYKRGSDAVSMQRSLWNYQLPQKSAERIAALKQEGYTFRHFTFDDYDQAVNFTNSEFGGGWARNLIHAVENHEAEDTVILCTDKENKIVGYCMRKIDGSDSRFGPIGVHKSLRSSGIGGCLLDLMMEDCSRRGIYYLYFLWTHGDAMRFYEKHGFETYRTYYL